MNIFKKVILGLGILTTTLTSFGQAHIDSAKVNFNSSQPSVYEWDNTSYTSTTTTLTNGWGFSQNRIAYFTNNSGVYPGPYADSVCRTYHFRVMTGAVAAPTMTFNVGASSSHYYTMEFLGATSSETDSWVYVIVNGDSVLQNQYNNTTLAVFDSLVPDGLGDITITVDTTDGNDFIARNALVLYETDIPLDVCDTLGVPDIIATGTSPTGITIELTNFAECFDSLKIFRDGNLLIGTRDSLNYFLDTFSLVANTEYEYIIQSINSQQNISADTVTITTKNFNTITLRNGEELYLNGINMALSSWGLGRGSNDFRIGNYDSLIYDTVYAQIADAGGNAIRHFLFFDPFEMNMTADTLFYKIPDEEIANIKNAFDIAEREGVYLCPVFCSYSMAYANSEWNRDKMINTQEGIDNFIDSVIMPVVEELYDHPALAMWEIMNEAEWMVFEPNIDVSKHELLDFIGQAASAIHTFDAQSLVTIGGASSTYTFEGSYSDDTLFAVTGDPLAYLDVYQPHYYEWMLDGPDNDPFSNPLRYETFGGKPVIIGEVPGYGDRVVGKERSLEYFYLTGIERGYSGVWSWAYFEDGSGWAWPAGQDELAAAALRLDYVQDTTSSAISDSIKISFGNGTDVDDWVGNVRLVEKVSGKYVINSRSSWYGTSGGSLTGVQPTAVDQSYMYSSGAGTPAAIASVWGIEADSVHAYAHVGTTNASHSDYIYINVNNAFVDSIIPYNNTDLIDLGTYYSGGDFNISVTGSTDAAVKVLNSLVLYELGEPVRSVNPTYTDTLFAHFTGNSITYYNGGQDSLLRQLTRYDQTTKVYATRYAVNGSFLAGRWDTPAQDSIENGKHDVVILQEYSNIPYLNPTAYTEQAIKWDSMIVANGGRTIHHMNHPQNADFDLYMHTIDSVTTNIGVLTNSDVSPTGLAWDSIYDGTNYDDMYLDNVHPTYDMSYTNACVAYATIFKKSPVGLPALLSTDAAYYQGVAWDTYLEYEGEAPVDPCEGVTVNVNATSANDTNDTGVGTASAIATNGQSPYSYLWSNGDTGADITGLTAGTYSVTATDDNGCTGVDNTTVGNTIVLPPNPCDTTTIVVSLVAISDTSSTSVGQALSSTIGGTTNYTYLWSNSATTQNLINILTGNYSLIVTDDNGCTGTNSITIPNFTITLDTIIVGVDTKLSNWSNKINLAISEYNLRTSSSLPLLQNGKVEDYEAWCTKLNLLRDGFPETQSDSVHHLNHNLKIFRVKANEPIYLESITE